MAIGAPVAERGDTGEQQEGIVLIYEWNGLALTWNLTGEILEEI